MPSGFVIDRVTRTKDGIEIAVHSNSRRGICPACGTIARRVHSRYYRRVADLRLSGQGVRVIVAARRFRCDAVLCGRQIFAERFPANVLPSSARRTARLEGIVHHLGLALGGRPAASFARRLIVPVSNDTLLRVVRRHAHAPRTPLRVIGIDDWAWRRNHRYGTLICDLEVRQMVSLLPDGAQKGHAFFAMPPTT